MLFPEVFRMRFIDFETFLHFRERAYRSHVGNDLIFIVNIAFNDVMLLNV